MASARKRRSDSVNGVADQRSTRSARVAKQRVITQYRYPETKIPKVLTLCHRCASIDFETIYRISPSSVPSGGVPVYDLGVINLDQSGQQCELCQLLITILGDNRLSRPEEYRLNNTRCYLRAFSSLSVLGLAKTKPRLALSPSLVLAVVPGDFAQDILILMRDASLAAGVILPTTYASDSLPMDGMLTYIGRRISSDKIDFNILRSWINECCETHPVCLPESRKASANEESNSTMAGSLLVIDCYDRTLVELPQDASYACISYVWGPTARKPVDAFKVGEKLPYPQAQTVEDAMYTVKQLDERYLWLDRYSIDQTNDEAKRQAILNMADIFEGSKLTIVALAADVDTGLWGISTAQRNEQSTARTATLQLVSSGPVLPDILRKSAWSKRGWTLQEALLSQRMLLFSERQVYWRCNAITYCESVQQPHAMNSSRQNGNRHLDPDLFSDAQQYRKRFGEMTLPLFVRQVAEYTKRELTYDSDALVAFYAILSRARERSICGIPIFLTQTNSEATPQLGDDGFALGLLWSRSAHLWYKPWREFACPHDVPKQRRKSFPSWSWTSTPHSVQFDPMSFDRELSNKYGQIFACTYQHSPYVIKYADIEIPEERDITPTDVLNITGMVVPWTVVHDETEDQSLTIKAELQLPSSISFANAWYGIGSAFLDHDDDIERVKQPGFVGHALLLVGYRRYRYNLRHVIWWMAIQAGEAIWHRIGLIRSFYEVSEPNYFSRGGVSRTDNEHNRPFLPSRTSNSAAGSHIRDDEIRQYLRNIKLA